MILTCIICIVYVGLGTSWILINHRHVLSLSCSSWALSSVKKHKKYKLCFTTIIPSAYDKRASQVWPNTKLRTNGLTSRNSCQCFLSHRMKNVKLHWSVISWEREIYQRSSRYMIIRRPVLVLALGIITSSDLYVWISSSYVLLEFYSTVYLSFRNYKFSTY